MTSSRQGRPEIAAAATLGPKGGWMPPLPVQGQEGLLEEVCLSSCGQNMQGVCRQMRALAGTQGSDHRVKNEAQPSLVPKSLTCGTCKE